MASSLTCPDVDLSLTRSYVIRPIIILIEMLQNSTTKMLTEFLNFR